MSLALAAVFGGAAYGLDALGVAHIVVGAASSLAGVNLLLGLFNLFPAPRWTAGGS